MSEVGDILSGGSTGEIAEGTLWVFVGWKAPRQAQRWEIYVYIYIHIYGHVMKYS